MIEGLSAEDDAYFQEILARRGEAVRPRFRAVRLDGAPPRPAECHRNADMYAAENPGFMSVRGWLDDVSQPALVAHSVVEDEMGELIEITCKHAFGFIRHHGSRMRFTEISRRRPSVFYRIPA